MTGQLLIGVGIGMALSAAIITAALVLPIDWLGIWSMW